MIRNLIARILMRLAGLIKSKNNTSNYLAGDRDIEWSWILANLEKGPGKVLDLGPGPYPLLSITAAKRNYDVLAIDRQFHNWPFIPSKLSFQKADIVYYELPRNFFDIIINCSTIEHIGLPGRYDTKDSLIDGDIHTMKKLLLSIKDNGLMLLTLPVGVDDIFVPHHRIYGNERLPKLLEGWNIVREEYWARKNNKWENIVKEKALLIKGSSKNFAIGCLVLTKNS